MLTLLSPSSCTSKPQKLSSPMCFEQPTWVNAEPQTAAKASVPPVAPFIQADHCMQGIETSTAATCDLHPLPHHHKRRAGRIVVNENWQVRPHESWQASA